MALKQGDTLVKGKYLVERLIGKGGCGEVYLVRHAALGKQYALKVLPKGVDHIWYEEVRARFQREAKLGAYIKDKHLIEVYDMEEDEEVGLLMRMEYAPGGSLRDLLEQNRAEGKRMAITEALEILLQAAEGLAALHAEDVIHRDMKPSNILFGEGGVVKVSDLGLAQIPYGDSRDLISNPSPHPGTPSYMSPEQANPPYPMLTPASDVFSLGLVLFEMLTGKMYKMTPPAKRRLGIWREDTPGWLEALFQEMLVKEPEDRPWDGKALAKRLQEGMKEEEEDRSKREAVEKLEVEERERQLRLKQETEKKLLQEVTAREEARRCQTMETGGKGMHKWWISLGLGRILLLGVLGVAFVLILIQVIKMGMETATAIESLNPMKGETVSAGYQTKPAEATPVDSGTPLSETVVATEAMMELLILTTTNTATETLTLIPSATMTNIPLPTETILEPVAGETRITEKDRMEQLYVSAGKFMMGSEDSSAESDEKPKHEVELAEYWIDKYEVTNGQYAQCVAVGTCKEPYSKESSTQKNYYDNSKYKDYPVIYVDWNMAKAYCEWAGRRLPTEAEWEKAARGTEGKKYPWGEVISCEKANYWGKDGCGTGDTTKVGSFPQGKSPYGAMDMVGNVWEWVSSLYRSYPYSATDGREDLIASGTRVLRGGSWSGDGRGVRPTKRNRNELVLSNYLIGFRCALSP